MINYSISYQRQAIEHLIALREKDDTREVSSICDAAKQACITLAWLERRKELVRALDRLERERPDLAELFEAFPGSEIADVRAKA